MVLGRTVLFASLTLAQSGVWTPAKLSDGNVPEDSLAAREGDCALFEVRVSPAGSVTQVIELAGRPPLTERVTEMVSTWRFEPAIHAGEPIATAVLVAVVARTPSMLGAIPPLPKSPDPIEASSEVPYPKRVVLPPFPPQARFGGVALLEAEIDVAGDVVSSEVVRTSHAFDELSRDALEDWEFHPGAFDGAPVTTRAYFLFSFRAPLTAR